MRALVGLLAWLAVRAGADIGPAAHCWSHDCVAGAAIRAAELGPQVRPNKAGRLVPLPEEALEADRPLAAHWAFWAAVALVLLIVAAGYLRRRWKAQGAVRPAWLAWPAWGRGRK